MQESTAEEHGREQAHGERVYTKRLLDVWRELVVMDAWPGSWHGAGLGQGPRCKSLLRVLTMALSSRTGHQWCLSLETHRKDCSTATTESSTNFSPVTSAGLWGEHGSPAHLRHAAVWGENQASW